MTQFLDHFSWPVMAFLFNISCFNLIKLVSKTSLVLWILKFGQVVVEIWACWDGCWKFSPNCEMVKIDLCRPSPHAQPPPIHLIDSKGCILYDRSHFSSDFGKLSISDYSVGASLLASFLTKGKLKFHPTTTNILLLSCFINVWRDIVMKVVFEWLSR